MNRRALFTLIPLAGLGLAAPSRAAGQAGDAGDAPESTACPVCFAPVDAAVDGGLIGERAILACTALGCGVLFTVPLPDESESTKGDT